MTFVEVLFQRGEARPASTASAIGRTAAVLLLPALLALSSLIGAPSPALASSGTWVQSDWSGGQSALTALDPGDRTGWTLYESKSDTVTWATYASSGALKLKFSTIVWPTSDDSAGATGFKFLGNASPPTQYSSSLRIQGSGEGTYLRLNSADPVWTSSPTWNLPGELSGPSPALGDLDGDGLKDMLVGASDGVAHGFKNVGTASLPAWAYKPEWNSPDMGTDAAPTLYDADGDGDLDLFSGCGGGSCLYFFENTGPASSPYWTLRSSDSAGWSTLSALASSSYGSALVSTSATSDYIYAFRGNNTATFARYSISGDTWDDAGITDSSWAISSGAQLVYPGSGDSIYAFLGNSVGFVRYSISGNNWVNDVANAPWTVGRGGSLVSTGTGSDFMYAFPCENTATFARYSISGDSWDDPGVADAPWGVYYGSGLLAYPGSGDYYTELETLEPQVSPATLSRETHGMTRALLTPLSACSAWPPVLMG